MTDSAKSTARPALLQYVDSFTAPDASTVVIKLKQAWAGFPFLLTVGPGLVLSPAALAVYGPYRDFIWRHNKRLTATEAHLHLAADLAPDHGSQAQRFVNRVLEDLSAHVEGGAGRQVDSLEAVEGVL